MEEIEIELLQEKEEQEIELMEESKDEQEISLENEPSLYGINSINDYEELDNKPQINNVELSGNKTLEELGIKQEYTANDITFEDGTTFQEKYNSGELNGTDGYTPVKGVDYFDGKNGVDGKDGYTPIKGVDYRDGKDGSNGIDGVSCTHSWNGTTLTITSASGTTSANLKGETGLQGIQGIAGKDGYTPIKNVDYFDGKDGANGKDGYTPVKGTDYFTEADKQEMVQLVLNSLPNSEGVSY